MINDKNLKHKLLSIISAGIDAVKPERLMKEKIKFADGIFSVDDYSFNVDKVDKVYVIGFGKVSVPMAFELEKILGSRISEGLVITNDTNHPELKIIQVKIGSHPILNANVLEASEEILNICNKVNENDLVICLISGGGSALFEKLPEEISLQDLQALTKFLIYCGASIDEINDVRKCLSLVKNGGLLSFIKPAKCISLIISDVVGDKISSIASSPTYFDKTSFKKANSILMSYNLIEKIPKNISVFFFNGLGCESETEEKYNSYMPLVSNIIIGNNYEALKGAEKKAKKYQLNTMIFTSKIQGEAREIAKVFSSIIDEIDKRNSPIPKPACIIAGGETTVTVRGRGLGGRNQELALATLISLKDTKARFGFASCGSDGIDGVTLAAGGLVHNKMLNDIELNKLSPKHFLNNNDAYNFLRLVDGLIYITPNQTNVMDIMVGIIY